jgi:hypothetical protein
LGEAIVSLHYILSLIGYHPLIFLLSPPPKDKHHQTSHITLTTSTMAVIWGLDLKEMQWGKFKGSYMFNQVYHLRKTKMIVYQIAMIFMVCSESVGTAALSGKIHLPFSFATRNSKKKTFTDS